MPHQDLATAASSALVVVDIQEPFARAMADRERLAGNVVTLIRVAHIAGVPVLVTEQNPEKLGPTVPEIRSVLEELGLYKPVGKLTFSCCAADGFVQQVRKAKRDTLLLTGMEAHVCVQQTALEALTLGYRVHVISDAVTSRRRDDWQVAMAKLRHAGAVISSTEMIAYELLGRAGTPQFKAAIPYLKW